MFSKLLTRAGRKNVALVATRAFRTTPILNQKPSIGDAVTILQEKVSQLSQVVSSSGIGRPPTHLPRTILKNSEP